MCSEKRCRKLQERNVINRKNSRTSWKVRKYFFHGNVEFNSPTLALCYIRGEKVHDVHGKTHK